jgi:hypothetical protein
MRFPTLKKLIFAIPLTVLAQTAELKMGVVYQCPAVQATMEVYSCTGTAASDTCDVQTAPQGRPAMRGKSTHQQVMALLTLCHLQTPDDAKGAARGGPAAPPQAQTGQGGFKVGDKVRVLASGWQDATILQIRGRSYYVRLSNGIEVSKDWPTEVRRLGALTAADHAAGQYDAHERVQVNINGRWAEGTIQGQQGNMYEIKVPGYRGDFDTDLYSTTPENIRMSTTPAPPPPAQRAAGAPPKPGYVSCAGKYEGRWESTSGQAGNQVIFRSGKVTVTEGFQKFSDLDCFIGEGKVFLYKAGSSTPFNEPLEINNDGTLQTELGAIKKMGN